MSEAETRRQLDDIERHLYRVGELLRRIQAERDRLTMQLWTYPRSAEAVRSP